MSGALPTPRAEVEITAALVRRLLGEQFPDLVSLELRALAPGWDNAIFRLGDSLVIRLPRRALGVPLIHHERRWLPGLAATLPLPIPVPVGHGHPSEEYPWDWNICRWVDGTSALESALDDQGAEAERLGRFLAALHQPATNDAPANLYRGVPLADRDDMTRDRIEQMAATIDVDAVGAAWDAALDAPHWNGPPLWCHGDVHPGNLVVDNGQLSGVIDFGDLTAGDPATDLSVAWMLFEPAIRSRFRTAAATTDNDTWHRARGWALSIALSLIANSADNERYEQLGRRTLAAVLTDRS